MGLLPNEIENLSDVEEQFFLEGFRMETEGLSEVDEPNELEQAKPPRSLFRRIFG